MIKTYGFSEIRVFLFEEMIEVLLILPLYVVIFVIFWRFRYLIKARTEINEIIFGNCSLEEDTTQEDTNKREFLMDRVKNGESISNSKTPWTEERLEKAFDKVIEKLYYKYQNPPPVKINEEEALELGKPICPLVIEMYAKGLKNLVDQIPYIKGRYRINVEKLKANISTNKLFCDNLAIKIGSKIIEQMGENSVMNVGVSLAKMTCDAVEEVHTQVRDSSENKQDE